MISYVKELFEYVILPVMGMALAIVLCVYIGMWAFAVLPIPSGITACV